MHIMTNHHAVFSYHINDNFFDNFFIQNQNSKKGYHLKPLNLSFLLCFLVLCIK